MAAFTEEQVKDFSIKNWYDLSGQVAVVTGGATGLGLAIAKEIMESHKGRLMAESEYGKGTTMTMWFPKERPELEYEHEFKTGGPTE